MLSAPPRGIVLDIEGTTTPVSFVYEVLFPHARARLAATCARAEADPRLARALERLRREFAEDPGARDGSFGTGAAYAAALMDEDRKSTGLKALQGLIWEHGYATGDLRSQVFPDVAPALARWATRGASVFIYSSGSVLAQKLLFGHTEQGDLRPYLSGYFDTETGPKREAASYRAIGESVRLPPVSLLFLSDVPAELDAAAAVGYRTGLLRRPGNATTGPTDHPSHETFDDIP